MQEVRHPTGWWSVCEEQEQGMESISTWMMTFEIALDYSSPEGGYS